MISENVQEELFATTANHPEVGNGHSWIIIQTLLASPTKNIKRWKETFRYAMGVSQSHGKIVTTPRRLALRAASMLKSPYGNLSKEQVSLLENMSKDLKTALLN